MKYNRIPVTLKVNRQTKNADIRTADTLLDVLRENFGLTGSKPGCLNDDCGSCTVLIDGCPMKSCIMLGLEAAGREIVTVEGLRGSPVQRAFIENNAFQCGYCTPGFIMNIEGLIRKHPDADDAVIEEWLQSNICRCTSYQEIKAAVYAVLGKETREDHK